MHNLQQRLSATFSFAVSALFTVLGVVAAISWVTGYGTAATKVNVRDIRVIQSRYGPDYFDYGRKTSEFGMLKFDIDADLTPLFNWNTKQVFVTVVAEYETKTHNKNQVVVWDKIIRDKDSAKINLRKVSNKYALIDFSQKWRNQVANLSVHWDVTPHVGILQNGRGDTSSVKFTFPKFESSGGR
ncbi:hypothetical protein K450DRAFT_232391 [Umbelopsis ramanniana AG]|uniref:Signal peptidase subunit 3 n=1 Tax=Umbelopsis ramanniana AG TaxID=1314678 RepID=A0AAD5EDP8_UMBRA|nr:uncharacterized protein K450DRAFT_232391 [Umbelopsis ramanniana AG]KAI8581299.1 hypothetical protein K450DRAFT_232391 [Umbelopsis ramanniana AG]